jgi:hypothetical protein
MMVTRLIGAQESARYPASITSVRTLEDFPLLGLADDAGLDAEAGAFFDEGLVAVDLGFSALFSSPLSCF